MFSLSFVLPLFIANVVLESIAVSGSFFSFFIRVTWKCNSLRRRHEKRRTDNTGVSKREFIGTLVEAVMQVIAHWQSKHALLPQHHQWVSADHCREREREWFFVNQTKNVAFWCNFVSCNMRFFRVRWGEGGRAIDAMFCPSFCCYLTKSHLDRNSDTVSYSTISYRSMRKRFLCFDVFVCAVCRLSTTLMNFWWDETRWDYINFGVLVAFLFLSSARSRQVMGLQRDLIGRNINY